MAPGPYRLPRPCGESGQATLLLLGVMAALLVGALLLGSWGMALGARGKHQRAADLAAVSAARAMADVYPRLFEPAVLPDGARNPSHLSLAAYEQIGRDAALYAGRRNGVGLHPGDVRFPRSFAPTRVTVIARGEVRVRIHGSRTGASRIPVRARATAELASTGGPTLPDSVSGGGYHGPLAYRQGKPMRPDVAQAFDRMAAAGRRDGVYLIVVSGYRSDAEQARLFAAQPAPRLFRLLSPLRGRGLPKSIHVLLRHRLLPQPGGLHGLLPGEKRAHGRDLAIA
jgi:D-alanyl-D-alanine carboxypeptidase